MHNMPTGQTIGCNPGFWATNWGMANLNPYAWSLANSVAYTPQTTAIVNPALIQGLSAWTGHHHHLPASAHSAAGTGMMQPRVEMAETNSDVVIAAELPNVSPGDINLTVTDDSVSISGLAMLGFGSISLYRTIPLPTMVKSEQADVTYANGVLEVRLPKADMTARRRIRVNPLPA